MMPKAGSLGSLARESFDVSDLEVHDDMLLIQIHCIGLNFADIFACQGLYSATPQGGFVPGLEFSGTVLKVGKSVTAHREGDRVMGVTRFGAFTTELSNRGLFFCCHPPSYPNPKISPPPNRKFRTDLALGNRADRYISPMRIQNFRARWGFLYIPPTPPPHAPRT